MKTSFSTEEPPHFTSILTYQAAEFASRVQTSSALLQTAHSRISSRILANQMKAGKLDALEMLRSHTVRRESIKMKGGYLYIGSDKLDINTETNWKSTKTGLRYNLGSLWLFLQYQLNNQTQGREYTKRAVQLKLTSINALDSEEVRKYFRGEIQTSNDIDHFLLLQQPVQPVQQVMVDPQLEDTLKLYEWSLKNQKAIGSKSKAVKTDRSYQSIYLKIKEFDDRSKQAESKRQRPIVIVPQDQISGNVCMRNIRQFLLAGEYLDPEKCPDILENRIQISNKDISLEITNSVDILSTEDWERVVAFFITGRKTQFLSWPQRSIANLFSKKRAFMVKWIEAAMGQAKDWNVCVLNVHALRSHENKESSKKFWNEINSRLNKN